MDDEISDEEFFTYLAVAYGPVPLISILSKSELILLGRDLFEAACRKMFNTISL